MATVASDEVAIVVVSAQPALEGSCGLCAKSDTALRATVYVRRASGTSIVFQACKRCERALRRLAAATHGLVRFAAGEAGVRVPPETETEGAAAWEDLGLPCAELIQEYATPLQDTDGALYLPRVCGGERADGTWVGWVEFVEMGGGGLLRTSRETTQPNCATLRYWASRLQPTYLEGAFSRAHRPHVLRLAR